MRLFVYRSRHRFSEWAYAHSTGSGNAQNLRPGLLRLLLLLLADADLEVLLLGFLVRLMIVPRDGVAQIGIHVGVLRKNRHNREALFAFRTERAETFDVGNCHDNLRISQVNVELAHTDELSRTREIH